MQEQEKTWYKAPPVPGSITNADINHNILTVEMTDHKKNKVYKMGFPVMFFTKWYDSNVDGDGDGSDGGGGIEEGEELVIEKFVKSFYENAIPLKRYECKTNEKGEETLDEVIDDYGNILSGDEPENAPSFAGRSVKGTDQAVPQSMSRRYMYYPDYGIGWVTW